MQPRSIAAFCGRVTLSGALALAVLTVFCCFYFNPPVHYPDPDGATDYRWEPNTFYSQATEGFSWGRTNNEGYHNAGDYRDGVRVDILLMGSSHMEGGNVAAEESTASSLAALLPGEVVYNLGTSGHRFPICAANLEKAAEKYRPARFVLIETEMLQFPDDTLRQALDGTLPDIPSHTGGLAGVLQREPLLRHLYHQWEARSPGDGATETPCGANDERLLGALLAKLQRDAAGARVIVFYHPGVTVQPDGTLEADGDPAMVAAFSRRCEANGVYFLDMS